jgi:ATP-dependent Clp protease ATP-binding subunit ClpA
MDSAIKGDDSYEEMKDQVLDALRNHFRPEFLNRIDETVVFHALRQSELKQIVDLLIRQLNKRLVDRKMRLEPNEDAKEWLSREGYDPLYGARPLKRLIQREIENPLSLKILEGEFADGDTILIDVVDDDLNFVNITKPAPIEENSSMDSKDKDKDSDAAPAVVTSP